MPEKCVICGKPILSEQLIVRVGRHTIHYNCHIDFLEWLIEKYLEVHPKHPQAIEPSKDATDAKDLPVD